MSETRALAVVEEQTFNERQVEIIRNQIAKGATPDELNLFLEVCRLTGLNPFMKQIYAIKRGPNMTIQTGIDGYRLVAARTGQLAGIDDPVYDTEEAKNPNKATVTVWRFLQGQRVPFTATARWSEYSQATGLWPKMPYLMLGKCAEALALRKAFPAELSGVYTGEEMQQADNDYPPHVVESEPTRSEQQEPTPLPVKPGSWADLKQRAGKVGIVDWAAHLRSMTGKTDPKTYTEADRAKVARDLRIREQGAQRPTITEEKPDISFGLPDDRDLSGLDPYDVKVS